VPTQRGSRRRVEVRRVYEGDPGDGVHRVLVDRLWPRGVAKDRAPVDQWAKDVAPSTELRRWYGHDPARFEEFARRYRKELARPPAAGALAELRARVAKSRVALVTATRDVEHSGARVLQEVLSARPPGARSGGAPGTARARAT
jgi:uncharacterized protein YeaO (DUF488 family)